MLIEAVRGNNGDATWRVKKEDKIGVGHHVGW